MSIKISCEHVIDAPKCPKCGKQTLLQEWADDVNYKILYRYFCPRCLISAPLTATQRKALKEFEEIAELEKQYKPQELKNMLELKDGGKGGAIAIGKLAQPLEAGTDLNEINAAVIYSVDTSNTPDCTAIYYKDPEATIKAVEYMRAQGYIVEATAKGIIIQGKAAGG